MLRELVIRNVAIIEDLHVSFREGLNVITGETGAGKSVLIDALDCILGARAQKDLIRRGAQEAFVQGVFSLPSDLLRRLEKRFDVIFHDDECIITREIYQSRPGVARLNDRVISLGKLRDLTGAIVDVFAQSEALKILEPTEQLRQLDFSGKDAHRQLLKDMETAYKAYEEVEKTLRESTLDDAHRAREKDLLQFQVQELEDAMLTEEDGEPLSQQYKRAQSAKRIQEAIAESLQALGRYEGGAIEGVDRALTGLYHVSELDDSIQDIVNLLVEARELLRDQSYQLESILESQDFGDVRELEGRMNLVNQLLYKYGPTVEDAKKFLHEAKERLRFFEEYDQRISTLQQEVIDAKLHAEDVAHRLSMARKDLGELLSDQMSAAISELNMQNAKFFVRLEEAPLSPKGKDMVIFDLQANEGEGAKPLAKVASGGEISRIMLALKSLFILEEEIPTVIFDEIDAGISGRTAYVVGQRLHRISQGAQVIAISHLPQIVAHADAHYLIQKEREEGRTTSRIYPLEAEARVMELARLISGADITETSLTSAREMLGME